LIYFTDSTQIFTAGDYLVGCIALLRLSHESDHLTSSIFEVYGIATIWHDLYNLYQGLKKSELERDVGCDWGKGVTPISRRIILRVISRLALYEMNETNGQSQTREGQSILCQLLQAPLNEMRSQRDLPYSAEKLHRLCEAAFDLSFFSPELVANLFAKPSDDLGIMFECVIMGYSRCRCDADVMCQQVGQEAVPATLPVSLRASNFYFSPLHITVGKTERRD
jgi:hypothetical protein